jgi:predicted dehydrogenase
MAPPSPLRVGIIGTGNAARAHAASFARLPGVAVTAIYGRTRTNAEAMAAELAQSTSADAPPVRLYDSWEELVDRGDIDVLSITTPPVLRRQPMEAALRRGLHVLVEKEFTRTLAVFSWQPDRPASPRGGTDRSFARRTQGVALPDH